MKYVKDTILKANHNETTYRCTLLMLYEVCQRYNFESKSQLPDTAKLHSHGCMKYVKDTILKANHNTTKE